MDSNVSTRAYWEREVCGTSPWIVGGTVKGTREWSERVERHRYLQEPHIPVMADFGAWAGKRLLEVGVGAGCDHVQFARAGAELYGVDLTDAAIEATRQHLELHGFTSRLQRIDAESLPYEDAFFDVVFSWGVIHHSADPERLVGEIHRVLRRGGTFIGMMYARHSLVSYKLWVRRALLAARPWRSLGNVLAEHMESPGTKAYTQQELRALFGAFARVVLTPVATVYDRKWLGPMGRWVPDSLGWNVCIRAWR